MVKRLKPRVHMRSRSGSINYRWACTRGGFSKVCIGKGRFLRSLVEDGYTYSIIIPSFLNPPIKEL